MRLGELLRSSDGAPGQTRGTSGQLSRPRRAPSAHARTRGAAAPALGASKCPLLGPGAPAETLGDGARGRRALHLPRAPHRGSSGVRATGRPSLLSPHRQPHCLPGRRSAQRSPGPHGPRPGRDPRGQGPPGSHRGGGSGDLRPRSGNTCLLSDYAGSGEGAGHGSAQGPSLLSQGDLAASGNPLAGRVPAGAGVRPLSATATVGSGAGRRVCRKPRRSPAPGPRGAAQSPVGPQWLPHDGGAGSLAVTTAGGLPAPPPTPAAPTHGGTGSHACRCRGSDPGSGRPWPRASLEGGTGGAAGPARPSPSTCGACCGCCSRGLGPYSPESGT